MNEATYNFEVCSFNEKIIKFGGTTENGRILSTIDIYYP